MLRFLKSFFVKKHQPAEPVPYKVEAPVVIDTYQPVEVPQLEPVKCGCGRSVTGFCVGLHKLTQEEWAAHPDNPVKPMVEAAPAKKPAAKKSPAKKKPAADKPAAKPAAITASKKRTSKKTPG